MIKMILIAKEMHRRSRSVGLPVDFPHFTVTNLMAIIYNRLLWSLAKLKTEQY